MHMRLGCQPTGQPRATRLLRPSTIYPKRNTRTQEPGISIMKNPTVMEMLEEMQIMECQSGDAFPSSSAEKEESKLHYPAEG